MMKPTVKLDMYDYEIEQVNDKVVYIHVNFERETSYIVADISSEITACDGLIYVEGHRYKLVQMATSNGKLIMTANIIN